jgi:hypothetical protein
MGFLERVLFGETWNALLSTGAQALMLLAGLPLDDKK